MRAHLLYRVVTPGRALPIAFLLVVLAGVGDALTSAEAAFTLFYVIPLALAVWFRGRMAGYAVAFLALCISFGIDFAFATRPPRYSYFIWNFGLEAALYALIIEIVHALRVRMREQIEEAKATIDQLRHADRLATIGKLASGVAHELGTPLNVISGRAEIAATENLGPKERVENAKVVLAQAARMEHIIHQLLGFSRRAGQTRSPTSVLSLARRAVSLVESVAKKRRIELDVSGVDVRLEVSDSEIVQVLSNLLTNAIDATNDGGRVVIEVLAPKGAEAVTIRVVDQGTGIAPPLLARVFEPFFTTKEVGKGTGLGLSVSYGIVRDHGGTIEVESTPGQGSTFSVILPRDREHLSRDSW